MSWHQIPQSPPVQRADGYVNMLNKYGTKQDNSTAYQYAPEGMVPDMELTLQYEANGLFAKIIDTPSEEAVKHGFDLGLKNPEVQEFIDDTLDMLEWEQQASTGIKWARLYGGALGVMFINDGRGIDEPLDWKRIKSIDEIRVYERAVVFPDYSSMYNYDPRNPTIGAASKFGQPEYYQVDSIYGQFWVHESRCLIFRNGILPERTMNPYYRFWGMPEFIRIRRELRETVTTHSLGVKLLERSVQPIYSMKGLASLLSMDDGENEVIKRLQVIDMARGLLNSIAIDSEGESFDFKTATMTGVKEIVDSTCNMLSAVTNIPQTILFGRSPAGQNSTGQSDLENYYNYVERHQKLMLRNNLQTLLDIIVRTGLRSGDITEKPRIKLKFNPLWSMSESEQEQVNQSKAQTQHIKAQTAQAYVDMRALDPSEVRKGLAQEDEFQVEELLDVSDLQDADMWGTEELTDNPAEHDVQFFEKPPIKETQAQDEEQQLGTVGVIVFKDGKVLTGRRTDNWMIGGPGGHIEPNETPVRAAIRETHEEFGITPTNIMHLGKLEWLDSQYGQPDIYICTDFDGTPICESDEMKSAEWRNPDELADNLFPPFGASLWMLKDWINKNPLLEEKNRLTLDAQSDRMKVSQQSNSDDIVCTDSDDECRAKDPSKCWKHGGQYRLKKAAVGNNKFPSGFNKVNLKVHFDKHMRHYPDMSKQQYADVALDLIQQPCGGDIRGYVRENGQIVRYNRVTKDLVIGNNSEDSDYQIGIATMHKVSELKFDRLLKEEAIGDDYY